MPKFRIKVNTDQTYVVDADNQDDAVDKVLSGDIKPIDSEYNGYDIVE